MSRRSVILSGLVGLGGAVMLTALCLFIMASAQIPTLLTQPLSIWGLFFFLLAFSLAEMPVMIFGIRRIVDSINPTATYVAIVTHAGYTFFAAVYAAPFILLTGKSWPGVILAALSLVRFISSVIFLAHAK